MTTLQKSKLLSNKAIKIVAAVILLAALIGGGFYTYSRFTSKSATNTANETPLQTAKATNGNLVLYANGTGTLMPAEESTFGFNTSGQVSEINIKIGDHVEWNSEAGRVRGTIKKKVISAIKFKTYTVRASKEEPQYLIKSDKTDHMAMHKGAALTKISKSASSPRKGSNTKKT